MAGIPDDADHVALEARYRWRRFVVAIAALALAGSALFGVSTPSLAAPGVYVDVQPELAEVAVGTTVTLTVTVRDDDGGPIDNANVRWYFGPDSPNDPEPDNNSPDLRCSTDAGGTCSISYQADAIGTDAICALVSGGPSSCDEAADASEWANNVDVVLRHVVAGDGTSPSADPSPSSDPSPSPSPITQPTATPTPVPSVEPTPTVEATPTLEPTPTPTPEPTPTLEPVRTAAPTPTATPETATPTPIPTVQPTPEPTALPTPQPTLDARPTPTPIERPTQVEGPKPSAQDQPAGVPGSSGPTPPPDDAGASGNPAPILPTPEQHADRAPEPSAAAEVPAPRVLEPEVAEAIREPDPAPNAGGGVVVQQPAPGVAAPAPAQPEAPARPDDVVSRIVDAAIGGVASVVRPAAAVAVAEEFTFPLALTLAVILYLVVQGQIDRRDPKLRLAPQNVIERVLRFQTEDEL